MKTEGAEGVEALGRPLGRRRTDRIVGASRAIQQLVDRATAAARSDLPVVITGPSGAGKKFLARAVHAWSNRASGPYRVISCGSLGNHPLNRRRNRAAVEFPRCHAELPSPSRRR